MEQVSYGPSQVCMVPPQVVYDLWSPHTLYGIGTLWFPHMYVWSPHMYDMMSVSIMLPHTLYRIGI